MPCCCSPCSPSSSRHGAPAWAYLSIVSTIAARASEVLATQRADGHVVSADTIALIISISATTLFGNMEPVTESPRPLAPQTPRQ